MISIKQKLIKLIAEKSVFRLVKIYSLLMGCFLVIGIWKWNDLPPLLPLFYSLPKSSDQLGTPLTLLLLPALSLFLFILDFTLSSLIFAKSRLASEILIIIAVSTSFLLLITYIKIIFLVS